MIVPPTALSVNFVRKQAREWAQKVVNLHNTPVPKEFEPQKQRMLKRAKTIKETIEGVTGTLPELAPMSEVGLGSVPLILGAGALAAAAAFITKWTLEYKTFIGKVQDRNLLISQGVDPRAAAEIVNQAEKPSLTSALVESKKVLYMGGGLFAAYLLAKNMRII